LATYLVTGGAGFVGSHLADALLRNGHSVLILDDLSTGKRENCPRGAELRVGDVSDRATVRAAMAGKDGCFHLAAVASVPKSLNDWPGTNQANLCGTVNVLDSARDPSGRGPVPVVYASSAAIYGDAGPVPLSEATPHAPLSPYGADKAASELHAHVAREAFGVPAVGLRFFNIFGPRQDPSSPYSGVISIFVERFRRGLPLDLYGPGTQVRDFVYVHDVVRALIAAMARAHSAYPVYNVCTGKGINLLELIDELSRLFARRPRVARHPARTGDIPLSFGDPSRLNRHLGVVADTSFADGLRRLVMSKASIAA
jgi:UDP-glucose 4-epimerase